jgi:hypothetical protein
MEVSMGSTSTLTSQKFDLIDSASDINAAQVISASPVGFLSNNYEIFTNSEKDGLKSPQLHRLLEWVCQQLSASEIQSVILSEAWCGKTYLQISEDTSYNFSYIKDVGHKLWRELSEFFGENVTKQNFRAVILRQYKLQVRRTLSIKPISQTQSDKIIGVIKENARDFCDPKNSEKFASIQYFQGRTNELTSLREWILLHKIRLLGIFGMAGCGKTTLAIKCVERIRKHFDHVLWRSLRDLPDFNAFIYSILNSLGGEINPDSLVDANILVSQLLEYFENNRVLLVIDDWSVVFKDNALAGIYQENSKKYGLLLRHLSERSHKSCVLITSREKPFGLAFNQNNLSYASQIQYLQISGLIGNDGLQALSDFGLSNCEPSLGNQLIEYYSGNPYALKIATNTICQIFDDNLSSFLRNDNLIYGGIKGLFESQFDRISEIEKEILIKLSQRPDPVTLAELTVDSSLSNNFVQRLEGLESLLSRAFLEKAGELFKVPEILRNYLTHRS